MSVQKYITPRKIFLVMITLLLMGMVPSEETTNPTFDFEPGDLSIIVTGLDPIRGKELFIEKKCVICHSVNGVGGRAATPLDATSGERVVDILDFAARMWRGSYAMVELQEKEISYQIELQGTEIGDLAAFTYDLNTQRFFSQRDVPKGLRDLIRN